MYKEKHTTTTRSVTYILYIHTYKIKHIITRGRCGGRKLCCACYRPVPPTTVVVIRIFVDRTLVRCHSLLGPKLLITLDQNIDKKPLYDDVYGEIQKYF